jgi:opacity protein-like surface antigen
MFAAVMVRRILTVLAMCSFAVLAIAQEGGRFNASHVNISAGGGFSIPTAAAGTNFNTGWNLDFRGGLNISPNFLADLDFSYNYFGLTKAALMHFGQPGGYGDVWSLTFNPVIRFSPHRKIDPYLMAGTGLYHRGMTLTQPQNVQTIFCDPFFGFCYPATVGVNQVVGSFSSYKAGFQTGGGFEFGLGAQSLKAFAEARYNDMFTSHGPNLIFVPVTFGLRW